MKMSWTTNKKTGTKFKKKSRYAPFKCNECGKLFYTDKSAARAEYNGCPKCHGGDIAPNY